MTNEDNKTDSIEPLMIDDKCDVLWRNGSETLRAVIIERRPLNFRLRKRKDSSIPALETLNADEIEYYVHYENRDR